MGESETNEQTIPSEVVQNFQPNRTRYKFFAKTGTKIGIVATSTFFQVRDFLNRPIVIPPANDLIQRFSHDLHLGDITRNKNGENDASKTSSPEDLKKIVEKSHQVLASATTVFPFTLFPDTIILDRTKITIIRRNFFFSSQTMSIRIEDVLNVTSGVGPFFGSITIASRVLSSEDHFTINYFWRSDAVHMKHLIQGYVIAQHNNIDTKHLEKEELISTLTELGHDSSTS